MQYYFKPSALKGLKKLSRIVQRRMVIKLDFYAASSDPLKFAESLKDKSLGDYRFRIGDYRIIFDVESNSIIVLLVGHRRDIYKK